MKKFKSVDDFAKRAKRGDVIRWKNKGKIRTNEELYFLLSSPGKMETEGIILSCYVVGVSWDYCGVEKSLMIRKEDMRFLTKLN